jgi:hypothetical protein
MGQERRRVAAAMEPVKLSANSAMIAKVRTKMIMTAPAIWNGTRAAKDGPAFSMS